MSVFTKEKSISNDKDLVVIQSLLHFLKSDPILKGEGRIGDAFENREIGYVESICIPIDSLLKLFH